MKKFSMFLALFVGIVVIAYLFMGEKGFLTVLFGGGTVMSVAAQRKLKSILEETEKLKDDLQTIDKKKRSLKEDGVEDKTDQEEVDYWKKQ